MKNTKNFKEWFFFNLVGIFFSACYFYLEPDDPLLDKLRQSIILIILMNVCFGFSIFFSYHYNKMTPQERIRGSFMLGIFILFISFLRFCAEFAN